MFNIKDYVIDTGIFSIYKRYRWLEALQLTKGFHFNEHRLIIKADYQYFVDLISHFNEDFIHECYLIFEAHRQKTKRLRKRIEKLLEKRCIFITFTFTDDVLANTNELTRRRYISRELRTLNVPYVANIDFGSLNEREHYHAIAQTDWLDRSSYDLGVVYVERILNNNSTAMAKYINKLVNHAKKETTGSDRIIFSR